jgi:hypothetical protein
MRVLLRKFADLKFVAVCCQKNALHSHLLSALDRYRIDISQKQLVKISDYLRKKFVVSANSQQLTASIVDPEQLVNKILVFAEASV